MLVLADLVPYYVKSMVSYERYEHAGQIPFNLWAYRGIKIPIFDKDSTLTSFHQDSFIPEVIEGLVANKVPDLFRGIALVSNSNDPKHIEAVAENLSDALDGMEVFGLCQAEIFGKARKPNPIMGEMVADHFEIKPEQLGVIGDRRLIDVRFGHRLGAGAIALCDKVGDGDQRGVPALRVLEDVIVSVETYFGLCKQ
jgi:predicted HAD superfamily phosphohydrolase YqeG